MVERDTSAVDGVPTASAGGAGIASRIAEELRVLGVRQGGVLLVHSSLRSLGPVPGGAETVVCGLLAALGPAGTLLMPSLSYASVSADTPFFDEVRTPSCVGYLTEYFRTRAGTTRSLHPTHSVAASGAQAQELTAGHHLDATPCGQHSPFWRLPQVAGQLLMLGCGLRPNTSMHAVEETVVPPYLYGSPVSYTMVTHSRGTYTTIVRRHGFSGWAQRYDRLGEVLSPPDLRTGNVLAAECHLIEAQAMWRCGEAALRQDPFCLVDRR